MLCDHMVEVEPSTLTVKDPALIQLENGDSDCQTAEDCIPVLVVLTKMGIQVCEAEPWTSSNLHKREDEIGWLKGKFRERIFPFFLVFYRRVS